MGTQSIGTFFAVKPKLSRAPTRAENDSSGPPSSSNAPASLCHLNPNPPVAEVIDVDSAPDVSAGPNVDLPPHTLESDPHQVLLAQLRAVISTLPTTIPLGCETDLIASFSSNAVTLIGPGQDTWEEVIHGQIDRLMYDGGRPKNSLELSLSVRRGELGMNGFANWLETCFFELGIGLGMLEMRIERIIQAMVLL